MIVPEVDQHAIKRAVNARGLELEEIRENPHGPAHLVAVIVDGEDGASLDTLASLARELDPLAEHWGKPQRPVTLEVSSRGVDAPLTLARHWRRNRARLVEISYVPGATGPAQGRIGDVDDQNGSVRVVHGKGSDLTVENVALDTVERAVVLVEFAPAPPREIELLSPQQDSAADGDTTEGN